MKSEPPVKKSRYHHGDLRQTLLDQAALMIREDGERALSMRKLAARAGVSRMAPYHHFADKQTLLCAVAEEGFRRFKALGYREELDDGMIAYSVIRHRVFEYVHFARDNAEYYDLMFGGHLWQSAQLSDDLITRAHDSFRHALESVRRWHSQGYILASIDPLRYSQVSWSTMHGISRLLIDGIYVDDASIDAICESAASMQWEQLTGRKRS